MSILQVLYSNIISQNEMRIIHKQMMLKRQKSKRKEKTNLENNATQRDENILKTKSVLEDIQGEKTTIQNPELDAKLLLYNNQASSEVSQQSQLRVEMGNLGNGEFTFESSNANNQYLKQANQSQLKSQARGAEFSDSSDSSEGEDAQGISSAENKKLRRQARINEKMRARQQEQIDFERFMNRQLTKYMFNTGLKDEDAINTNIKYIEFFKTNLVQRQQAMQLKASASRNAISNQLHTQQCRLVQEFCHIQNQQTKHVFTSIHMRDRDIRSYVEKRQSLKNICPIIQKIQEVEIIKVGRNPRLNVNDLKSLKREKLEELYEKLPQTIITMDDLDESQNPQIKLQQLINEQRKLKPEFQVSGANQRYIRQQIYEMNQIQKSIKRENLDDQSAMKKELQKAEIVKFEQKQAKFKAENPNSEIPNKPILAEIPLSLEEKSKYGYGFDLEKYKIDPGFSYKHLQKKKELAQPEIKKENVQEEVVKPKPPKLIMETEEFDIDRGKEDYQHVKDELYNLEGTQRYQNLRVLDDIVKQEEEHIKNPYIDYNLMKLLRLDDEAQKYMEQKYYKQAISGLIGKIFNIPEETVTDPDMLPGHARCRYCNLLFASWRVKRKHEIDLTCVKSDDFVRVNRKHMQQRGHHELVWGDQLLLHSSMSINRINYQFSRMVGNMVSRRIEPFDRTEVLQTETESYQFYRLIKRVNKLLKAKILSQQFQIPFSEHTFVQHTNRMADIMIHDLRDTRCTTFELGIRTFARKIPKRDNVFITPNFLQNFDFFGGYEEKIVETKVVFAGLQLGILLLNEIDEISKFLWWRQEILMRQYKYEIHDFLEYRCFWGIYHETQEHPSTYQIHMLDNHRVQPKYNYEYKKCPFYLRYKRTDPTDKTTPYLLTEFDMTHTHPLGFHQLLYLDMLNLFEIKRRSRVEYVMYEKNECFINQYEFNHKKQKDLVCD